MIQEENNSIKFTSRTFHWWPFSLTDVHFPGLWRGFVEQNNITLTDTNITVSYTKKEIGKFSLPIKDLEYCIREKKFLKLKLSGLSLGNTRVSIGGGECGDRIRKNGNISYDRFYIDFDEYADFIDALKARNPLCFSPNAILVKAQARWYRIDQLLSGNRNTLWMNARHSISSEDVRWGRCIKNEEIKFFFTRGVIFNNLYIGSDERKISLSNVKKEDVSIAQNFIRNHGGNIAGEAQESYTDAWSPSVIFRPSLWFAHSSIGFTDKGVVYNQKTFKTNDNIFLPYEKINTVTYESKWYWPFTIHLTIFGEQNINPVKSYSRSDVEEIKEKLKKEGVKDISGKKYTPSCHSSWFGILLSILTLSLYHCLVAAYKGLRRRNTLVLGKGKIVWHGTVYGCSSFIEGSKRKNLKDLSTLFLDVNDIVDVVYIKKHWYHIWGGLFIWTHPRNIRAGYGGELSKNQNSVEYDLELCKIWSSDAKKIISSLEDMGFTQHEEEHKIYKRWCEDHFIGETKSWFGRIISLFLKAS